MKLQPCLASLGAAAALAFASAGQAAVVSLVRNPAAASPPGAVVSSAVRDEHAGYHPLFEDASWTEPSSFAIAFADRRGPKTPAAASEPSPFYAALLDAGQYVLEFGALSSSDPAPTQVSTAPLPGAIWLFGSGLVAFLVISGRRKL